MSILWILAFNGDYIMTVAEFRQLATNINYSSSVPELYKIDVKRILNNEV